MSYVERLKIAEDRCVELDSLCQKVDSQCRQLEKQNQELCRRLNEVEKCPQELDWLRKFHDSVRLICDEFQINFTSDLFSLRGRLHAYNRALQRLEQQSRTGELARLRDLRDVVGNLCVRHKIDFTPDLSGLSAQLKEIDRQKSRAEDAENKCAGLLAWAKNLFSRFPFFQNAAEVSHELAELIGQSTHHALASMQSLGRRVDELIQQRTDLQNKCGRLENHNQEMTAWVRHRMRTLGYVVQENATWEQLREEFSKSEVGIRTPEQVQALLNDTRARVLRLEEKLKS